MSAVRPSPLAILALALALAPGVRGDGQEAQPGLAGRDPEFALAKAAIERKDWSEAILRLSPVAQREPGNADVQNLLGFAWRNTGKYTVAFKHYHRALELDPAHRGAHEYIGEAYLKVGDLANAEKHLEALRRLCPNNCEQRADLEREVAEFRKKAR